MAYIFWVYEGAQRLWEGEGRGGEWRLRQHRGGAAHIQGERLQRLGPLLLVKVAFHGVGAFNKSGD